MKFFLITFLLVTFISTKAYSHSGGTNSDGCHAGSKPYHCHNGGSSGNESLDFSGWDFNLGYQYHIDETPFIPYAGLSVGKYNDHEDTSIGIDFGLKHQDGWYAGFVSTSKSVQLGYRFVHFSANSDSIGIGVKFTFGGSDFKNQSSIYSSGTVFFAGDE